MAKMPWIQFFPDDWLYDTRILNHIERAVWIDLLCFMWNAPERGILTGHPQDLARMVGLEWMEFRVVLDALKTKNIINLTEANEKVTVVSRRMVREEKTRESNRIRQREFYKREKERETNGQEAKKPEAKKLIKDKDGAAFSFEAVWTKYPNKDGRKKAEGYFRSSVKTPQDFKDINSALGLYLSSERVSSGFIKDGSTWFNNWRDWINPSPEMLGKRKVATHAKRERSILDGFVDKELREEVREPEMG